jgi:uncharacterized protein (TIGR03435 family)
VHKRITAGFLLAVSQLASAQSTATPTFEVASIKPATPPADGRMMIGFGGDKGRINYTNVSLMNLITNAYRVRDTQVSGPAWINTERFNVTAKIPEGVSRDQVPEMLQVLLAERFKLKIHKESKVLNAYALVPAKGGPKLHPAEVAPGGPATDGPPSGDPFKGKLPAGAMRMMLGPRGRHMTGNLSMQQLADMLSRTLDRPVLDMTEIKGIYEVDLEWSGDEGPMMRAMRPLGGEGGPKPEGAPEHRDEFADAPSIFTSLQDKLGLKLDPRKEPVDLIVIDNAEKVPTDN